MAYTTIDDPSLYFQIALYTGNGNDNRAITNDGNSDLQPDWIWFKNRSTTNSHNVLDSTRGVGKTLEGTNTNSAEGDTSTRLTSFDSDGFTVRTDPSVNGNGNGIVAWQWKANGGTTSSNSDGSITSTVQANTTAGFSIITYTGNGTAGATVGHGLGAVPSVIINKGRDEDRPWAVYHHKNTSAPETEVLILDTDAATIDNANRWNDTAPTSSVMTIKQSGEVNVSGEKYVSYHFTEIQGYSKFGSYKGNYNADGPFIYTGFKPAFVLVKETHLMLLLKDFFLMKMPPKIQQLIGWIFYLMVLNQECQMENIMVMVVHIFTWHLQNTLLYHQKVYQQQRDNEKSRKRIFYTSKKKNKYR